MQVRHDVIFCFVVRPDTTGAGYEFLLLRRSREDYLGGTWQTIGGQIEPAETAVQAALRELKEEAGLAPAEFYQLDPVHSFYVAAQDTIFHCVQFCAVVGRDDPVRLNDEHDAYRWVAATAAATEFMWPGDRRAVEEVRREILADGLAKPYMRLAIPKQS